MQVQVFDVMRGEHRLHAIGIDRGEIRQVGDNVGVYRWVDIQADLLPAVGLKTFRQAFRAGAAATHIQKVFLGLGLQRGL